MVYMEQSIQKNISKPLSNKEILKLIKNKANLISYKNIHDYDSLDELLGKYGACIILYESRPDFGHWCCIFKNDDDLIEFFDPYALYPDFQLKYLDKKFRDKTGQNYPYLSRLMLESPYDLSFNHYKFQKLKKGVNTCGRWCATRLMFRDMPLDDFIDIFNKKRNYPNDFFVTYMTNNI